MTNNGKTSVTGFPHGIHRVLVVKPSSLRDILHIFPALEAIHRVCPAAKLDFLIAPAFAPLLSYSPWPVERTILFERRRLGALFSCVPETLRLIRNLRRERYDLVIDFQGLLRSAFFAAWARSPIHAGFAAPRERAAAWFYSRRIGVPAAASHAVERALALARGLFPEAGERIPEPELPVDPDGLAEIAGLPEPVIALLPGARWESKTFPASLFAAVAEAVHKRLPGYTFVTVGGASDRERAEEINRFGAGKFPLVNYCGKTSIPGMIELLRHSAAVVSNDSGPIHAAALLHRPVFAFYGPTLPELTGPFGSDVRIFRADVECLGCRRRECPGRLECHRLDAETIAGEIVNRLTAAQRAVRTTGGPGAAGLQGGLTKCI